jgi:hypothetical protein
MGRNGDALGQAEGCRLTARPIDWIANGARVKRWITTSVRYQTSRAADTGVSQCMLRPIESVSALANGTSSLGSQLCLTSA